MRAMLCIFQLPDKNAGVTTFFSGLSFGFFPHDASLAATAINASRSSSSWVFLTAACAAIFILGMWLHLRWHPLRQHLSDAWDFLQQHRHLLWISATASIVADMVPALAPASSLPSGFHDKPLPNWTEQPWDLAQAALQGFCIRLHEMITAWPAACILPLLLSVLTWRVWRQPYRYGRRQLSAMQRTALIALTAGAWCGLGLELADCFKDFPEGIETLRVALRWCSVALFTAGVQTWIIRLVIGWEQPVSPEDQKDPWLALEHVFSRWPQVTALAAWNVLWMTWPNWPEKVGVLNAHWLLPEVLLVFAPLPLAVAYMKTSFLAQGAEAMRALLRCALPLAALALSATFLLMPVHYASEVMRTLTQNSLPGLAIFLPLNALALATVHNWLFLTAVLTMLRLGFPQPGQTAPTTSA